MGAEHGTKIQSRQAGSEPAHLQIVEHQRDENADGNPDQPPDLTDQRPDQHGNSQDRVPPCGLIHRPRRGRDRADDLLIEVEDEPDGQNGEWRAGGRPLRSQQHAHQFRRNDRQEGAERQADDGDAGDREEIGASQALRLLQPARHGEGDGRHAPREEVRRGHGQLVGASVQAERLGAQHARHDQIVQFLRGSVCQPPPGHAAPECQELAHGGPCRAQRPPVGAQDDQDGALQGQLQDERPGERPQAKAEQGQGDADDAVGHWYPVHRSETPSFVGLARQSG